MTLDDILGTVEGYLKEKPVVLIDSDTIIYRAASATDGRQYVVQGRVFKYKSDAEAFCKKTEIPLEEIELEYYPEPVSHALKSVKISIERIKAYARTVFPKGFRLEFFHTSSKNFREDILDGYKSSRSDTRKPEHLPACKSYVESKFYTLEEEGLEADDLIGIRSYELRSSGTDYLIVTNDKDLDTIPGKHFNWVKEEEYVVSDSDAMKFFYSQCIAGDNTDDIPGVDGLGINVKGTGKAQKIINGAYEEFIDSLSSEWCNSFDNEKEFEKEVYRLLECHLFEAALGSWIEGGPGKKGKYGCESVEDVYKEFEKSAKCLFILHERDNMWEKPDGRRSNYRV